MAALAFLFAVFRSRPSPFYMMDEVEATLDDVNLSRFLASCTSSATRRIDPETWDSLEEALIRADVQGGDLATALPFCAKVDAKEIRGGDDLIEALGRPIRQLLQTAESRALRFDGAAGSPDVWADRRGQRRGQDDDDRQAGSASVGAWPVGPARGGDTFRRRGRGPGRQGRAHGDRHRAGRRGWRPERRRSSTRCSGRPPGATTWSSRTPRDASTPRSTWSRRSRRSAGWPAANSAT